MKPKLDDKQQSVDDTEVSKPSRLIVFTAQYRERVMLPDGQIAILRVLRAQDRARFRRGFERMSDRTRVLRFLKARDAITDGEIDDLLLSDSELQFGLGLFERRWYWRDGDLLASAHFRCDEDQPDTAEVVIGAIDDVQGMGIGSHLLRRLSEAALERRVEQFTLSMLSRNDAARHLFARIGFSSEFERHAEITTGTIFLKRPMPEPANPVPAADDRGHGLMKRRLEKPINALLRRRRKSSPESDE